MFFTLLEMIQSQGHHLVSSQPACQEEGEQGSVAFSLEALAIGCLPKRLTLLCH
jgi:hypothetical protein